MTNQERKERIKVLQDELHTLLDECPHECEVGGSWCTICRGELGWYCETSPTKHCVYPTPEQLEADPNLYWESCIYCGDPEERK